MLSDREWKAKAGAKAASICNAFPKSWQIPQPIATAHEQRDITGSYLHKYLTDEEIQITESNAVEIVQRIRSGKWRAESVARAFCHRAALAHQYVSQRVPIYPQGLKHVMQIY